MRKNRNTLRKLALGTTALLACGVPAHAQSVDALLNKLVEKGVLTDKEANDLKAEAANTGTNQLAASKWKISDAIKDIALFGDVRLRYEYRGADTVGGLTGYRERFRYALRVGLRGDLFDNFYYGLRLETSQNSRSPWVTMGDESSYPYPGPSSKTSDGINVGQVYVGWRPKDWLDLTVGRMPNPLYTTPMIWDPDINPEGAAEKFKYSLGSVDLFGTFGQFLYQDANPDQGIATIPSFFGARQNQSDAFLLAWQVGANIKLKKDLAFKIAPTLYNYTGHGQNAGFPGVFVGQGGLNGQNYYDPSLPGNQHGLFINQSGINDLLVFETPAEFNFKLGPYRARVFGDFAYNLDGDKRAEAAFLNNPVGAMPLTHAYTGENKAYQIGFGLGNLGLVYGQTSKKNTWEGRVYWQRTEQYAVDVNLSDSDFFEGRGNLEGIFSAFAYSFTDNIIGTVRYGYAQRINPNLGTGGSNQDLPQINPVDYYNLVQLDLTWRF